MSFWIIDCHGWNIIFTAVFLGYYKESVVLREGDNSGSPGIFVNPEISFKKEEIPKYVYQKYDIILCFYWTQSCFQRFNMRNVQCPKLCCRHKTVSTSFNRNRIQVLTECQLCAWKTIIHLPSHLIYDKACVTDCDFRNPRKPRLLVSTSLRSALTNRTLERVMQ